MFPMQLLQDFSILLRQSLRSCSLDFHLRRQEYRTILTDTLVIYIAVCVLLFGLAYTCQTSTDTHELRPPDGVGIPLAARHVIKRGAELRKLIAFDGRGLALHAVEDAHELGTRAHAVRRDGAGRSACNIAMIDAVIQTLMRPIGGHGHVAEGVARAGRAAGADIRHAGGGDGLRFGLAADGAGKGLDAGLRRGGLLRHDTGIPRVGMQLRDVLALARVAAGAEVIAVAGGRVRRLLRDDPLAPVVAEGGDGVVIILTAHRAGALVAAGLGTGRLGAGGGLIAVVMALGGDDLIDLHAAARAGADGAAGLRARGVRDEVAAAQVMAEGRDLLGAGRAAGRAFIKRRALRGAGGRVCLRLDPGVVGGGNERVVHGVIGAVLHRADMVRIALLRAGGGDDRVGELGDVVTVPEAGLVALPRAVVLQLGGPGMAALRIVDHAVIREGTVGIRRAVDALGGVVFEDGALELRDLCDHIEGRADVSGLIGVLVSIVRTENAVEHALDEDLHGIIQAREGTVLDRVDPVSEVGFLEHLAAGKGALVDLRDAVGEVDGLHMVVAEERGLADREGLVTGAEGEVVHIIIQFKQRTIFFSKSDLILQN